MTAQHLLSSPIWIDRRLKRELHRQGPTIVVVHLGNCPCDPSARSAVAAVALSTDIHRRPHTSKRIYLGNFRYVFSLQLIFFSLSR